MLHNIILGLTSVFSFPTLFFLLSGVIGGLFVGSLPGFTSTMGIAVLLPLTFGLNATNGILTLIGIYVGGIAGGCIPAIALNIPGTPASTATTFDGYILTKQGQAGKALSFGLIGSALGGLISAIFLITIAPQLAKIALQFGPPEYFALGLLGLTIVVSVSSDNLVKGLIVACLGFIIATIGTDPMTSFPRFTFGNVYLMAGISYVPLLIGLFGLSEAFSKLEQLVKGERNKKRVKQTIGKMYINWKDIKSVIPTIIKSSCIGAGIGALPGAGADIASFTAYDIAKRTSKNSDKFGKGTIEGVVASEAGNNSNCGGAMIPMLTFGIPGDAQAALLIAALMMQGLNPGPLLFQKNPEVVWTLFVGFICANIFMLVIGVLSARYIVRAIDQPAYFLYPAVTILSIVGAFAINNNVFDIAVACLFGFIGYFMKKYKYPLPPVVLALILAPMIESQLRRSLIITQGNFLIFFKRPFFIAIIIMGIISLVSAIILQKKSLSKKNNNHSKYMESS